MLVWLQTAVDSVYGVISDTVLRFFPLINLILMIIAGCFGSLLVGKIKPALRDALLRGLGLLVLLMGCTELWNGFFVLQVGQFETTGTMLVVVSLVLGYGLPAALGALGPNLVQGLSGVIIACVLLPLIPRIQKYIR